MANDWLSLAHNPGGALLKQHIYQILKEKAIPFVELLERVGFTLTTERDIKEFGELVLEIYKVGFSNAVKDYEQELRKLGYEVKITVPEFRTVEPEKKIFK